MAIWVGTGLVLAVVMVLLAVTAVRRHRNHPDLAVLAATDRGEPAGPRGEPSGKRRFAG